MEEQNENLEDKAEDAMRCFFGQFGRMDIYAQIVLEEFFKEILDDQK